MFMVLRKIAENTNEANKQLDDVCNQHRNVKISFVPNPVITSFLFYANELGDIKQETADSDAFTTLPEINFPPKPPPKYESHILEINKRMHLVYLIAYLLVYLLVLLPYPPEAVTKRSDKMNVADTKPSDIMNLTDTTPFGIPNVTDRQPSGTINVMNRKPCDIFKITLSKKSPVYVKQSDDSQFGFIKGVVVTATGTLLLTDLNNKKLKAFSSDGTFLSSLSLSGGPRSIALINATTAVLSTSELKLHYPRRISTFCFINSKVNLTWVYRQRCDGV